MNDYFDYVSRKIDKTQGKAPAKDPPKKVEVIEAPEEFNEPEPAAKPDGSEIQVEESDASASMIQRIRNFWK